MAKPFANGLNNRQIATFPVWNKPIILLQNRFAENLYFEIVNFLAFMGAALRFRDKKMRLIVWGTTIRQIKVYFFKQRTNDYVDLHRKGECSGCGSCCRFIRKCPYLNDNNSCGIYENRHWICRIYPISDYDIQLVSRISDKKCGFCFKD